MRTTKALETLGLLVIAALSSQFAMAQAGAGGAAGHGAGPTMGAYSGAPDAGWYAGANIGQSRANIDESGISSRLLGAGFTTATISNDDSDTGYKLFAGYKFNRNFALEGGYFDLGSFGYTATTVPAGTLTGNIKLRGLNLDAVGILPINRQFSAFGRVGVNYAEAKDSFSGTGAVTVLNTNPSKREANLKFGAGLQYDFTNALGMRLEAERYRINDAVGSKGDVDLLSLGLVYRFSGK
ncbi:MAG: outer membrane beta-barrel protein [Burkholderiales bacterium]|nr:outer membrane beta-barrel protein [Burkholderiales bacterium]